MAIKHPYLIEVFWSEEDEAYIANVPDLPGCSAAGTTEAEAIVQRTRRVTFGSKLNKRPATPSLRR